ncbi:Aldose sugar dehydrogenase YliI [Phycisphaerales bacterium]|nr:Aldose sugar dehydrogenase YliI [Phycisphaerales bacterium]
MRYSVLGVAAVGLLVTAAARAQRVEGVDQLWKNNCAKCHGGKGEGGGAGTRTLLTDELYDPAKGIETDRLFFETVKNGLPDSGMDAFGATMSDAQVWAMVNYIRELQREAYRKEHGSPKAVDGVFASRHHAFRLETVIDTGLDVPWSVEFLPGGNMLVAERNGRMRVLEFPSGTLDASRATLSAPIENMPKVRDRGQGGLMDIAIHPLYAGSNGAAGNGWVYLSYSDTLDGTARGPGMTKIVRGKLGNRNADSEGRTVLKWEGQQTIFEAKSEHYLPTDHHFGCRLVFEGPIIDEMHYLYFSIGERGHAAMAQDVKRPNGKVHRVWDDGQIPKDNPFAGQDDTYGSIWSFGHRNPQGLVFDLTGNLWDTEHGPRGGDEVNLIQKGRNYGWPTVTFGIEYSGAPLKTPWPDAVFYNGAGHSGNVAEIAMPTFRWMPSIGACGLTLVKPGAKGEAFPKWKGDLLAGGLSGANVDRLRLEVGRDGKTRVVEREELVHGQGRVRDVVCGPDGSIYVVLNVPDKVVRLVPADSK